MNAKRTIFLVLLLTLLPAVPKAQTFNANPDPEGDPWWVGGMPTITPEIQAEIDSIPELVLSPASAQCNLPPAVDNSQEIYFRPIFLQEHGCCAIASGVAYTFTYEINRLRDLPAYNDSYSENWYPTHYIYNFLNQGGVGGTLVHMGWKVLMENGSVNVPTWGGMGGDHRRWISGYANYHSGMHNKVDSCWRINVGYPQGLETLKRWLHNHNEGEGAVGGLACFSAAFSGATYKKLPPESADSGKQIVTQWANAPIDHAMTFVGYNDSVKYDFNNDGQFTNHLDINGDSTVDMKDWEIGALKIANSHGDGYMNDGFVYMPYKILADTNSIAHRKVLVMEAKQEYSPQMSVKAGVDYPDRNNLEFSMGYAENANTALPKESEVSYPFWNNGGDLPMQGINSDPIEIGMDYGHFFQGCDVGQVFLIIDELDLFTPYSDGTVQYFSLIDHRWGEDFELPCEAANVPITHQGKTYLSINYDLVPFTMEANETFDSDKVSRFSPIVANNAALTIGNNAAIDFYNSTWTIAAGSQLNINSQNSFNSKRGYSSVEVYGSMAINDKLATGVDIKVKPGGTLTIGAGNSLELLSNGRLTVEQGATLIINDNATVLGSSSGNSVVVNGSLQMGSKVTFKEGMPLTHWDGLQLSNAQQEYALNGATFQNCGLLAACKSLAMTKVALANSNVYATTEHATIDGCTAINSCLEFTYNNNPTTEQPLSIANCDISGITGIGSTAAIRLSGYPSYSLSGNTISNCNCDGIAVYNSGNGSTTHQLTGNSISNCQSSTDNVAGIRVYGSHAEITGQNKVNSNKNGIISLNNSNVELQGLAEATSVPQAQQVMDNSTNQVYASYNSFPLNFEYNAIVDEDNTSPLVYYSGLPTSTLKAAKNYWGSNFNASQDLYPSTSYDYLPIWDLGQNGEEPPAEGKLYAAAVEDVKAENYAAADAKSKQLVQDYPDTEYAKAGMKLMPMIEGLRNGDFGQLKNYYTKPEFQNNDYLGKLAAALANRCDLEQGNYRAAIDWFESVILDPETLEDSVFAIIDLEHTYLLMENSSGKHAGYVGKLSQYKPESREAHAKHRTELMNLLGGNKVEVEAEAKIKVKGERLIVNKPNPFNGSTVIAYKLEQQAHVCVNVYNISGQKILTLVDANKGKGAYTVELSASQLPEGIYTYTLELDGSIIERNKMLLVK